MVVISIYVYIDISKLHFFALLYMYILKNLYMKIGQKKNCFVLSDLHVCEVLDSTNTKINFPLPSAVPEILQCGLQIFQNQILGKSCSNEFIAIRGVKKDIFNMNT